MNDRPARRTTSVGLLLAAVGTAVVAATVPASAHVTVQPASVEGGGFSVVSVRVPNERDDAATTKVRLLLPVDQPLGSVQTTPVPGWRVSTSQRDLDEPLELFGAELSRVVSEVTWTATDGGVRPGQFQDFAISLGQLPEAGELVFKAVQTYSSGEEVAWNQVAVDEAAEPERPAPVLTLTAPGTDPAAVGAADSGETAPAAASEPPATTADAEDDTSSVLPLGISVVALLIALGALGLALKRRTV